MIFQWIRFGVCALLMLIGLFAFFASAFGVNKFDFVLNRLHAAGIADTLGMGCIVLSLIIAPGTISCALKLLLAAALMGIASPLGTHLLSRIEYMTNGQLKKHCKLPEDENGNI